MCPLFAFLFSPALPFGWPLEGEAPSLAHRLHRFLDSK